MVWYFLPVTFLLCAAGSWLSYSADRRQGPYYVPGMVLLGAACAVLFAYAARLLDSKEKLYIFSLWYDALMLTAYYVLPLLLFGARPTPGVLIGAGLVAVGMVIVTVWG